MAREPVSTSLQLRRLVWAGPVTVLGSIAANLLVRAVAVTLLHPQPKFLPLTLLPVVVDTTVLVTCAVLVFAAVARFASNPIRKYHYIAAGVLLFSFIPDVWLGKSRFLGATWPYVFALMAMHVAAWGVCVTLLPKLTRTVGKKSVTPGRS